MATVEVKSIIVKPAGDSLTLGQYSALQDCRTEAAAAAVSATSALASKNSAQSYSLSAQDSAEAASNAAALVPNVGTGPTNIGTNSYNASLYAPIAHVSNASNPHSVTKSQVGLGNVTNDAQIAKSLGTAKGDIIVYTSSDTPARLAIGTDAQVLTADSGQAGGVKWADAAASGPWQDVGTTITRASDSTFTVTNNTANQAIFVKGRPIRFRQNSSSSWCYAIVTGYSSGTVTIGGAAYTSTIGGDSGRGMQYGDMTRLHQETFVFHGAFADAADSALIANDLLTNYVWQKGKAYCVKILARPKVDDSGASQSRVNVTLNSNAVATTNSNAGLAMNDAAWAETTTDISTSNYAVEYGQAVEVAVDGNGTNKDAHDLTLIALFVLE